MTFTHRDVAALAEILREAARSAIMPRFRNLSGDAVRMKSGPLDLVTEADEAAEEMIGAGLRRRFPGCAVVGEEAASADPALLAALPDADLAFVVDPIDGTANFAAGLPLFGTMAAALVRGTVVAAAILDPVGDDTALALRGEGAWMEAADGRRTELRVAGPVPLEEMTGMVSWRFLPGPERAIVCRNLPRLAATWEFRCAAHSYRLLAGGFAHFVFFNRLLPWDHAPGWLLHREAGGYSAQLDGADYDPTQTGRGLICAPDEDSWTAIRDGLLPS
ncbi:MAG: inositol monophosphatase [Acetobacteraceae bacterium]|nr:inositol monophosphatase [Acetobacteraceae bacterium]